ncbi:ATP-binding cassette, subfamily B [Chitinophaga terrae (ex Kim and Jung 2007)]|uniref:ATP-binding cassette, subfamily B n=1 Tax=Chitinophaga terrae (ex Kim and Jung 2007) TaxID=408074 RepID=A0A1H3YS23_9BACT|nr:ABC transporter ATP-binding protein [Chitinophaga terrae (ex Kim and Jung 2007)]GEP88470.1 multidrug ABC transporter ATP-binding protein [Chitinophaga terrae (ex Kim and Jung 2007)]SEA14217.1 ATP-binding cassette, subfamily B [Chitinophaga terrae (ex Kim and Jung 2007)]
MNYNLNKTFTQGQRASNYTAFKNLLQLITSERKNLWLALGAILLNSAINLLGPLLISYAVDHFIVHKEYRGLLISGAILICMYLISLFTSYFQTKLMGRVGQRTLFTLRNAIFNKIQQLPVAFFNQNKAGDLISRVNNDTDKLNQFFSQALMQFLGSIANMVGAGIFLLALNVKMGAISLLPALLILLFTRVLSPWVKRRNAANLKTVGALSAEIQESLGNFKAIVAFNRRDYFRKRFSEANTNNYNTAVSAGIANNIFLPFYALCSSIAQLLVLVAGIYLISQGEFTIGLVLAYLGYTNYFYTPLRQLATLWANFQVAMAGWDRISEILNLESDLVTVPAGPVTPPSSSLVEFRNVHFGYPEGKEILHNINLSFEQGKTYALVGPTGGGKTTTASLIARLYDPTKGTVLLSGKDIRSYSDSERTKKIGFILQEPFLFSGTIRENILYGNSEYLHASNEELVTLIREANLEKLLAIFEEGLDTRVTSGAEGISLGQKQIIAFMRAVLRKPDLLILDEATANIDTVTEQLLEEILQKLPATTTRVIIAHRLNTIENADEIYFVNSGEVTKAGSFQNAMEKLMQGTRES